MSVHQRHTLIDLELYESISTPSTTNWSRHVQGAVGIAKARGTAQFEDPQSLVLFRATRTQMLMDAIQRREAVGDFPGPEGWLGDSSKGSLCSIRCSIKMPDVLARAKTLLDEDIQRTPETFQQVCDGQHYNVLLVRANGGLGGRAASRSV